jgi:hypothetical protein
VNSSSKNSSAQKAKQKNSFDSIAEEKEEAVSSFEIKTKINYS